MNTHEKRYQDLLDKDFNKMLSAMPKNPDADCGVCGGIGEFYAMEDQYLPCYCTNDIMYQSDAEIIFHYFLLKKNGKPKKEAKKIFEELWMMDLFQEYLEENK